MRKVYYNNRIAKAVLLDRYSVVTLFCFVLCKYAKERVQQFVVNHECVHTRQWTELTISSGMLIWCLMLLGASPWWLFLCVWTFYLLYGMEFLVRLTIALFSDNQGDTAWHKAYLAISFEREARRAEQDDSYLENSHYFAWHTYWLSGSSEKNKA